MKELAENLFPDNENEAVRENTGFDLSIEEVLIRIPGAIVHLIDKERSVELACGEFTITRLRQGDNVVAVLARVGDEIQWPLAKDEAAVKLDESHYFFTLRLPSGNNFDEDDDGETVHAPTSADSEDLLNYGLTFASKGQENLLDQLDSVLEHHSAFTVQKVADAVEGTAAAKQISPAEIEKEGKKKEELEGSSAAYWTILAPNVEDYSGCVARMIAAGSGQLIKGILWGGDVTVDRLKWGKDFLKRKMGKGSTSEISPQALRRMKRVKKLTKMTEKMASGILSGVVKVSGFFTSSIANSKVGKKFFSLLPGEIVLASLDGFNKVCDAVEVAGRNVMSTTSVVTTGLVSHRYGEDAAKVTHEGLDAAGYAIGTAWAVFKIRKAINPKSVLKPTNLVRATATNEASSAKLKASSKSQ